jgi:hypothetical protein
MPLMRALVAMSMSLLTTVPQVTVSLASWPMGALTHRHPPQVQTVWSPGVMPL